MTSFARSPTTTKKLRFFSCNELVSQELVSQKLKGSISAPYLNTVANQRRYARISVLGQPY